VKKPLLTVLVPFIVVVGGTLGIIWWDRGALPGMRPTVHDVTVQNISRDDRGVRVRGTAHYSVRLQQRNEDRTETWYLFPLMAKGDLNNKDVRVIVRTSREPDSLYSFEDLQVEGLARPPGRLVPIQARDALFHEGYMLDDGFVLIEAFEDGVVALDEMEKPEKEKSAPTQTAKDPQ